jgi:hypothetical protein
MIPPTVSGIAYAALPDGCHTSVLDYPSHPELDRWYAERQHYSRSEFRRLLRFGSGLPCLSECLFDLSEFEIGDLLCVADETRSVLSGGSTRRKMKNDNDFTGPQGGVHRQDMGETET